MAEFHSGEVTFLFTDIEGSTRRWEAFPDAMGAAVARHDALLREIFEEHGGHVFKTVGDAFCTAFTQVEPAVLAAVAAQRALMAGAWGVLEPFRVRMAVHCGPVQARDGDYFGPTLNRVARLLSIGAGGQTLLSGTAAAHLPEALPGGLSLRHLGEHRLKDLQRAEQVFQVDAPGLPGDFPALRSLNKRNHNLPVSPTPLVGREAELTAVTELLFDPAVRMVTLVGPGGTGKTSLSLQVGAEALGARADFVYFVELEACTDVPAMVAAIAHAMEQKEVSLDGFLNLLNTNFSGRRVLILLDNFEQVTHASAAIGRMLAGCPHVRFLATSRAPLRLHGEREYPLQPLAVPPANVPLSLGALARYPAVELFVQRAQAGKPSFELSAENAAAVAEICRRLDGLPLALELAAARIKMLTPAGMLGYLENRLKLLTGGARDLPERQRTLRGAIDWSHDLLTPAEAALFRQLAVFSGGFTLEHALAVCGDDGEVAVDVFEGISALVERSLLRQVEAEDDYRFSMLGTIRDYAAEKLDQAEAVHERPGGPGLLQGSTRERHARYFAELAARPGLGHGAFETEHENWRGALDWFLGPGQEPESAAALARQLADYWERSGRYIEARGYLERCLQALRPGESPLCARLAGLEGWFAYLQADYPAAEALQNESLERARAQSDEVAQADALNNLGLVAHMRGQLDVARSAFEASLNGVRSLGDRPKIAARLSNLGLLAAEEGEFEAARAHLVEADANLALGDLQGKGACACNLSELALRQRDWLVARDYARKGLESFRELGDRRGIIFTSTNLATAALELKEGLEARSAAHAALTLAWEVEMRWMWPVLLQQIGRALLLLDQPGGAAAVLAAAQVCHEHMHPAPGVEGAEADPATYWTTDLQAAHPGLWEEELETCRQLDEATLVARGLEK